MKITPIGGAMPSSAPNSQPQVAVPDVRRITMNTQASPVTAVPEVEAESTTSDNSEVPPVVEDTKPLDPQLAALAQQRRALQVKEKELTEREKALEGKAPAPDLVSRIKSEPLSVLLEHGVTYDQLTEAILSGKAPQVNPEIYALKQELKALKEGVDKTLTDKDLAAEQQVLSEIQKDIERASAQGDEFAMIRETGSQGDVKELIHRTYKETGEILDVSEAMQLVENELINESLKRANIGKVRSRLSTSEQVQQQNNPQRQIKTLTNRDNATRVLSRKERALAAALGTLKR